MSTSRRCLAEMEHDDPLGFAITFAFALGLCLFGAWGAVNHYRRARFMLDTPTSKIRSAAQGYVELNGQLKAVEGVALQAPLTGTPCLWWRYRIEEYQRGKDRAQWRVVDSGVSSEPFQLDDGTGRCLIDPRGAHISTQLRKSWQGNQRHPRASVAGGLMSQMLGVGSRYRYVEERLQEGQALYAIGQFRTVEALADAEQLNKALIKHWKADFAGLLERFDHDGNGELDAQEWERVRQAARVQVERQLAAQAGAPAVNRLAKPSENLPFVLSDVSEQQQVRRFYWRTAGCAMIGLVGALACAWLLGVDHW